MLWLPIFDKRLKFPYKLIFVKSCGLKIRPNTRRHVKKILCDCTKQMLSSFYFMVLPTNRLQSFYATLRAWLEQNLVKTTFSRNFRYFKQKFEQNNNILIHVCFNFTDQFCILKCISWVGMHLFYSIVYR